MVSDYERDIHCPSDMIESFIYRKVEGVQNDRTIGIELGSVTEGKKRMIFDESASNALYYEKETTKLPYATT
jgi:hypothetical protein